MINKLWAIARDIDQTKARVTAVATSVVTVAAVVASALQIVIVDLADTWPDGSRWAAQAAAGLLAVVAVIRRVTPVDPPDRGLI